MKNQQKYDQLIEQGFCKFEQILTPAFIERLRLVSARLAQEQNSENPEGFRSQGSMIGTPADPIFAELIAWPPALEALQALGFDRPTFTNGYVISKPPHSPRLFWHYDWFAWEDLTAYEPQPPQLFLMYYLSDTYRDNGCAAYDPRLS
jgi:hypothetical protein